MQLEFAKYQANGNDYILIDSIDVNPIISTEKKKELGLELARRHYSIGADDVIYLESSRQEDANITIIEPDGSEADMCGNGIRCAAAYLFKKTAKSSLIIETRAGLKEVTKENGLVRVNMGKINMDKTFFQRYLAFETKDDLFKVELDYNVIGKKQGSIIYTGEPNIVFIEDNIDQIDLKTWGGNISLNRKLFPLGICTVLIEYSDSSSIKARFFEKGVYRETNACGTGATAAAYIANKFFKFKTDRIKVKTKGGEIFIEPGDETYMTGEALEVYHGYITLP